MAQAAADTDAPYDNFVFGRRDQQLMEQYNWTPKQIGELTLYQMYLALGYKPAPPAMTPEEVDDELARMAAKAKKLGH